MSQQMKFEVVALYPNHGIKGQYLSIRAHVYIVDWDLDIRGFLIIVSEGKPTKVCDPMMTAWDFRENKVVRFPVTKCIGSGILEEVKEHLKLRGEEEFKKFDFPEGFPKGYADYCELIRASCKNTKEPKKKGFDKFSAKKGIYRSK